MGSSKRQKGANTQPLRSRTTRSSKARLLSDPAQNTQQLNNQLRSLGLYAANTLGDGNCLFRALSDQLYGTPSHHLKLREDICNWIQSHKLRYEPFVEDDRGLDVHLRCMRQQGTYGGHLELSAFAHLTRRDVKVMQPGLVYLIEWAAGWDPPEPVEQPPPVETQLDDREKRRRRRDKRKSEQAPADDVNEDASQRPVYVAYYDWEHFDSIRNLRGPHTGIPNVTERADDSSQPAPTSKAKRKPESKVSVKSPPTPSQLPLPTSRSPSPAGLSEPPTLSAPYVYPALPNLLDTRVNRSPKRSFDESSASEQSETSESASKKARSTNPSPSRLTQEADMDTAADGEGDTPGLSPSGFSSESELSSLASSPEPTPAPEPEPARMTRRQRKALGVPKPRSKLLARTASSGKIVIPGGKYKKRPVTVEADEAEAEWTRNGTGRVDVRGFRELKI